MMYATVAQFRDMWDDRRLAVLLGDVTVTAEQDVAIGAWLAAASARIDGVLASCSPPYVVPVVATGDLAEILRARCLDLALGEAARGVDSLPEALAERHRAAVSWLAALRGTADYDDYGRLVWTGAGETLVGAARV